jgi:hypothetical protein
LEREIKKNITDWEKSVNEGKVRIGLKGNRRRGKKVVGYRCHNTLELKFIFVYRCASHTTGRRNLLTLLDGLFHSVFLYYYNKARIKCIRLSAGIWLCYAAFFCSMLKCFFIFSVSRIATQCLAHEYNRRELTNR